MRTKFLATLCAFGMLGLTACGASNVDTSFFDEHRCAQSAGFSGACLRWEKK